VSIVIELAIQILGGLLRVLVDVAGSVAVGAPQAFQPGYTWSPRALFDVVTWPVRAAARHPWRLVIVLVVAWICIAAAWRS
jgi:hypothetical protein